MKARIGGKTIDLSDERVRGDGRGPSQSRPCKPTDAPSPYRSKWELRFAQTLDLEKKAGAIRDWAYERYTVRLAKGKYHRPDFTIWHLDGTIEMAQVKGYHKNLRASMTALAWAAKDNPWFRWTVRRWGNGGFQEQEVSNGLSGGHSWKDNHDWTSTCVKCGEVRSYDY